MRKEVLLTLKDIRFSFAQLTHRLMSFYKSVRDKLHNLLSSAYKHRHLGTSVHNQRTNMRHLFSIGTLGATANDTVAIAYRLKARHETTFFKIGISFDFNNF